MITNFKSALNKIKAEEELVKKTEKYLKETLIKNEKSKIDDYINDSVKFRMKKWAEVYLSNFNNLTLIY